MSFSRKLLLAFSLCFSPLLWAHGDLPQPKGPVVLTISGDITHTNVGDEAHFDYDMLVDLGLTETVTGTPWTTGQSSFEGPLGRVLLASVGATGQLLKVKALNNFVADVPVSDFYDHDVILAIKRDGEPMPVRDFGPIFVLYPWDEHPELLTETIRFRSVWQVANINVQ